ncbi:MAG: DEAD/DEAH box helicase [Deltaproteobacteria bacterium]|jgi:superfamily II DNA or RNA helicase|nr:DEAD/DEAH box helicase [Deltaproteobacteria bacterium]
MKAKAPVLTVAGQCHLSNISPSFLQALQHSLTIDNPKYKDAKKYGRWVGKNFKRKLVFFELAEEGILFPRGFAAQAVELCKRYMGRGPVIKDLRRRLEEVDFNFYGTLRPYQEEAVKDIMRRQFGVLVSATGSGKTVMAFEVIAKRRQPTLILVHSRELMYQWEERARQFLGIQAGLIGDSKFAIMPLSIAIVNTARKRLVEITPCFGHLIVDECHRVPATLFTEVVKKFDSYFMLGLSATAYRREDGLTRLIYLYMGDRSHQVDPEELTASGAVLKPEFIQKTTDFKYIFRGNYQALMNSLTKNEIRTRQIAEDIHEEAMKTEGIILVVSDRVAHCRKIGEMLAGKGVQVTILTGRQTMAERTEIVEAVHRGDVKILIATLQLVGEGFDAENLTTLFLTTPIKFTGRLKQVIGRILRPASGKQPKVIDYVDEHIGVLRNSAGIRRRAYEMNSGCCAAGMSMPCNLLIIIVF